jgi:hypothetical protein
MQSFDDTRSVRRCCHAIEHLESVDVLADLRRNRLTMASGSQPTSRACPQQAARVDPAGQISHLVALDRSSVGTLIFVRCESSSTDRPARSRFG